MQDEPAAEDHHAGSFLERCTGKKLGNQHQTAHRQGQTREQKLACPGSIFLRRNTCQHQTG